MNEKEIENLKECRSENPGAPTMSLNTRKGADAIVPVLEKHSVKSGFFTKVGTKGQE